MIRSGCCSSALEPESLVDGIGRCLKCKEFSDIYDSEDEDDVQTPKVIIECE